VLETVRRLVTEWSERQSKREAVAAKLMLLSPREKEVLDALVAGKTTVQIARLLGISPSTVEKHRLRIFEKTGEDSVIALIRLTSN
jgi:two-component system response regulator FixJ